MRRSALAIGANTALEREHLLRLGFGDAVGDAVELGELEARALRVAETGTLLPRYRQVGALRLDLLRREGWANGQRLGLHPREFALLWWLADVPGESVAPATLLREVWDLAFRPETNSLAVHVSRVRAKLRLAGIEGLIETTSDGAYRLVPLREFALDDYTRLREDWHETEREAEHEA